MPRRLLLLACLAAVAGGCELVAGINDKTLATDAGIDSGVDATPPEDAPRVDDADAQTPVDAQDSAPPIDSGLGEPSAPCNQQGVFQYCNDFDTSSTPGDNWDFALPANGGSLALDTTDFASPPKSVQTIAPATANAQAQLGKNAGATLSSWFHVAFDLRIDMATLDNVPQVGIAQINTSVTPSRSYNFILGPGNGAHVEVYEGTSTSPTASFAVQVPPLKTWTRVVMSVDATKGFVIYENGNQVGSDARFTGTPGGAQIIVGTVFVNLPGTNALKVELDNVLLRGQ